jgi:glucosamine kinase
LQDGARLPVVFLGGLGPVYAARLAGRWEIRAPKGSGVDGALRLAREEG